MGRAKKKRRGKKGKERRGAGDLSPTAGGPGRDSAAAAASRGIKAATAGLRKNNAELVARLRSVKHSDRESACLAIAHLFSSENKGVAVRAAKDLLGGGLMRALVPRLSDPSPVVRLHASGALRNLTSFSDPEISDALVKDDAVTPVLGSLRALSVSIAGLLAKGPSQKRNPKTDNSNNPVASATPPPSAAVDEMTWIFSSKSCPFSLISAKIVT